MGLLQNIVFGLTTGSYIAVAAVGFTLVYGVVNMIDFAFGETVTVGAFAGYAGVQLLGLPPVAGVALSLVATAVFSLAVARAFFRPIRDTGPVPLLLASIGAGLFLRNGFRLVAGRGTRFFDVMQVQTFRVTALPPVRVAGVALLGDFYVTTQQLLIIGVAVASFASLHLLLTRSDVGIAMRAVGDDDRLARVAGIDTDAIRTAVWLIAGALGGLAGFLLAVQTNVNAGMGFSNLLPVIAAAILGGAGSPYGAIAGSYVIGLVMALSVLVLPSSATALSTAVAFLVLILVLLVKPEGIAGAEVREA